MEKMHESIVKAIAMSDESREIAKTKLSDVGVNVMVKK